MYAEPSTGDIPVQYQSTAHRHANVDQKCLFTDGGGRGSLKTAHSDVPFSILRHAALDEESDGSEIGPDCLSKGDIEEALSSDSDSALQD